uniref:Uncharacterized protein n=1 Tax=Clastoptera arizonana TaxID=38151 RepID=A0A1B6DY69_9HEMI
MSYRKKHFGIRDYVNQRAIGIKSSTAISTKIYKTLYESLGYTARCNIENYGGIFNLEFSPDGGLMVAACERRSVLLFDPITHKLAHAIPDAHDNCVNGAKFLDDRVFATCSDDKSVVLWDARNLSSRVRTFIGHTNWVKNIEYFESKKLLVTSAFDGCVFAWDVNSCADNKYTKLFHTNGLMRTRLTPDLTKMIISTTAGYIMVIHDINMETLQKDLAGFKPSMYRLMQTSRSTIPTVSGFTHLFSRTRKKNRVEFIADFPAEDEAEVICSLQVHPHGWCVLSRNVNATETSEWTCVHDIQEKYREGGEETENSSIPQHIRKSKRKFRDGMGLPTVNTMMGNDHSMFEGGIPDEIFERSFSDLLNEMSTASGSSINDMPGTSGSGFRARNRSSDSSDDAEFDLNEIKPVYKDDEGNWHGIGLTESSSSDLSESSSDLPESSSSDDQNKSKSVYVDKGGNRIEISFNAASSPDSNGDENVDQKNTKSENISGEGNCSLDLNEDEDNYGMNEIKSEDEDVFERNSQYSLSGSTDDENINLNVKRIKRFNEVGEWGDSDRSSSSSPKHIIGSGTNSKNKISSINSGIHENMTNFAESDSPTEDMDTQICNIINLPDNINEISHSTANMDKSDYLHARNDCSLETVDNSHSMTNITESCDSVTGMVESSQSMADPTGNIAGSSHSSSGIEGHSRSMSNVGERSHIIDSKGMNHSIASMVSMVEKSIANKYLCHLTPAKLNEYLNEIACGSEANIYTAGTLENGVPILLGLVGDQPSAPPLEELPPFVPSMAGMAESSHSISAIPGSSHSMAAIQGSSRSVIDLEENRMSTSENSHSMVGTAGNSRSMTGLAGSTRAVPGKSRAIDCVAHRSRSMSRVAGSSRFRVRLAGMSRSMARVPRMAHSIAHVPLSNLSTTDSDERINETAIEPDANIFAAGTLENGDPVLCNLVGVSDQPNESPSRELPPFEPTMSGITRSSCAIAGVPGSSYDIAGIPGRQVSRFMSSMAGRNRSRIGLAGRRRSVVRVARIGRSIPNMHLSYLSTTDSDEHVNEMANEPDLNIFPSGSMENQVPVLHGLVDVGNQRSAPPFGQLPFAPSVSGIGEEQREINLNSTDIWEASITYDEARYCLSIIFKCVIYFNY